MTTHENQWAAAEGALFENFLFAESTSVTWPLLANAFQLLYLRATRQPTNKPTRQLGMIIFLVLFSISKSHHFQTLST